MELNSLKPIIEKKKDIIVKYIEKFRSEKMHFHGYLECYYIKEGEGICVVDEKIYYVKSGDIVIVLPYQLHRIENVKTFPMNIYIIQAGIGNFLDSSNLFFYIGKIIFSTPSLYQYLTLDRKERYEIETLLQKLTTCEIQHSKLRSLYISIKFLELLIMIVDKLLNTNASEVTDINLSYCFITGKDDNQCKMILYVMNNYDKNVCLSDIAKRFNYSPSVITRIFKKITNKSFYEFLCELRIRHAISEIITSNKSLQEIAIEVGFSSYAAFRRAFVKMVGILPSEYKRRIKCELESLNSI